MSEGFNDKQWNALLSELKPVIPRLVESDKFRNVLHKALAQLNDQERELVAMKTTLGIPSREIIKRFDLKSRQALTRSWKNLIQILRTYMTYFAVADHDRALKRLPRLIHRNNTLMIDIFAGRTQTEILTKHGLSVSRIRQCLSNYRNLGKVKRDKNVRVFLDAVLALHRLKRL